VAAIREGLERMGIKVTDEGDRLTITGSPIRGSVIDSKGDHRIAMAFSLLGSKFGGATIDKAECVAKTYPEFWETLKRAGGKVKIDGR
jgi:3-phosphoshikimate 1-carboxyvinyltransferase